MEQKQRMQASCAKAALWIGIVFWLVALSLALRLIYTGYAAIVPAQRYHAEPMADGSWHIAIEGSPLAFSNVADHSLISSDENPANPKALHLILLGRIFWFTQPWRMCFFCCGKCFRKSAADARHLQRNMAPISGAWGMPSWGHLSYRTFCG